MNEGPTKSERRLAILLLVFGVVDLAALPAVFLPTSTMAAAHERLGLGPFPDGPLLQYLARTASAMYALYGAILIFVSRDVRRYAPLIRFLAIFAVVHAALLFGVDRAVGMPAWWLWTEGPVYAASGAAIFWAQSRIAAGERS